MGAESIVSMASVMGLESHHPIMSTLWEHRNRSKRKEKEYYRPMYPTKMY